MALGQRREETAAPLTAASVHAQLGAGQPLDSAVRARMERGFGESFGRVRVHADHTGAALSSRLDAHAFAVGEHVAFAPGTYQPGTLRGDALIAHELAHTVQQRNALPAATAASESALERDANRTTIGGMARMLLGKDSPVAPPIAGMQSGGLALSRCTGIDPLAVKDATVPTVTDADFAFLDDLESSESLEENYEEYIGQQRLSAAEAALSGGMGMPMPYSKYGASAQSAAALQRFTEHAAESGDSTNAKDWRNKKTEFESLFEKAAITEAYSELQRHEALIQGERDRYGNLAGVTALRTALAPHKATLGNSRVERLAAAPKAVRVGMHVHYVEPSDAATHRAAATSLAKTVRDALAAQFPIVLADELLLDIVLLEPDATAQSHLLGVADDRIGKIQLTRGAFNKKPSRVWKFDRAVKLARERLNIVDGSVFDLMIRDKCANDAADDMFQNLLIGVLAIGLGMLTAGTGTVAVLAATAGATLSAGMAASHLRDFMLAQAAAGTALEKANALSSEDPSLFWLAVDVLVAFVDLGMAARAFQGLKTTAQAVKTVADAEALRAPAKALATAEKLPNPEAVAETVVQEAKQHVVATETIKVAESTSSGMVAALRAAVNDERAIAGLLKIESSILTKVLSLFKGKALIKLGHLIEEFPQVAKTLEELAAKLPIEQFQSVLGKYLYSRSTSSKFLLRAAADAGLDAKDFEFIADALKTTKSSKQIAKKIGGLLIGRVAERLPAGEKGIKTFLKIAPGLHPNQSAQIFERWAAKNIYGQVGGAERFTAKTTKLAEDYKAANPSFKGESITSDTVIKDSARSGEAGIGDFKSHLNRKNIGTEADALRQADNYKEMLRVGVKTATGEKFTWVEYLFANRTSAEASYKFLKNKFGDTVKVFFVDEKGAKTLFVPAGP